MTDIVPFTAIMIARKLWAEELQYVPTRLEDEDNENCVLCECAIPQGPAWLIVDVTRYAGVCCWDLARLHGVTRWETEHNPAGMPLVPAHLAAQFPPNVQRIRES